MKSPPSDNTSSAAPSGRDVEPLDSVRSILLADVRRSIRELERRFDAFQGQAHSENESLSGQVGDLMVEAERLRLLTRELDNWSRDLKPEFEALRRKAQADSEGLIARITPC